SQAQWQVHVEKHILPAVLKANASDATGVRLGKLRIDQIRVADVDAFRDERRTKGKLAPQSVNKLLTTLEAILKFAERRELITRNPAAVAERCRLHADEVSDIPTLLPDTESESETETVNPGDVLSPTEARSLVNAAPEGFDRTFLLTALLTGGR